MGLFPKNRDLSQPLEKLELQVDRSDLPEEGEGAIRLDQFLAAKLFWRSRTSVQRLIREGFLAVESPGGAGSLFGGAQPELRPGRRLQLGARVVVTIPPALRVQPVAGASPELEILHEDEHLLAVAKPPFLAVHPSGRHLTDTLIQRVHRHYGMSLSDREQRPRLCHRLDRETSGIVLIGKDPWTHAAVMGMFERREVAKRYLAIVRGVPKERGGIIDLPLAPARNSSIGLRMAVDPRGQRAVTRWELTGAHGSFALLQCEPLTGRQHQIRVHLEAIGHPIVGDKIYGHEGRFFQKHLDAELSESDWTELGMQRHALHNHRLQLRSPHTGSLVDVICPLPQDMRDFLSRA